MFDFCKWLQERKLRKEARVTTQAESASSPYNRNLEARHRMGDYLSNPENAQKVSPLQAKLLEGNGGLVVGGCHEQTTNKERE